MRRTKIAILLTVILFSLSACGTNSGSGTVFDGGTNGILFSFERDTPPDLVYDNGQTPFQIIVKAKNDGEFDVSGVRWRLTGINTNDFPQLRTTSIHQDRIIGKTRLQGETLTGEEAYLQIADDLRYCKALRGGGELDYTINALMCYPYATLATSTVCLQEDYLDGESSGCDPRTTTQFSVSGAPVTITGFKQQAIGSDKLRLEYEVALQSSVDIWAPMSGQDCRAETRGELVSEQDWVYVKLHGNGLGTITCVNLQDKPGFSGEEIFSQEQAYLTGRSIGGFTEIDDSGYLKLGAENAATLACTLTLTEQMTDSLGTVDLALSYYVGDSMSKTFSVTHTSQPLAAECGAAPEPRTDGIRGPAADEEPSRPTPTEPTQPGRAATAQEEVTLSRNILTIALSDCRDAGQEIEMLGGNLQPLQELNAILDIHIYKLATCLADTQNCDEATYPYIQRAKELLTLRAQEHFGSDEYTRLRSGDVSTYEEIGLNWCLKRIDS